MLQLNYIEFVSYLFRVTYLFYCIHLIEHLLHYITIPLILQWFISFSFHVSSLLFSSLLIISHFQFNASIHNFFIFYTIFRTFCDHYLLRSWNVSHNIFVYTTSFYFLVRFLNEIYFHRLTVFYTALKRRDQCLSFIF